MSDLDDLRAKYAAAVAQREKARLAWLEEAAAAKLLKQQIHAIEHPPRPKKERGLRPDDDLAFLDTVQPLPKDPAARRAEVRRRQRIRSALAYERLLEITRQAQEQMNAGPDPESIAEFIARRDREHP